MLRFLVLASSMLLFYYIPQTTAQGIDCKADIVIVFDESSSLRFRQFGSVREFLEDLLQAFRNWGIPDGTRVGLISFADAPRTRYSLITYQDPSSRQGAIDATNAYARLSGITNTNRALDIAKTMLDASPRPGVPQAVFLLTDGIPDTPTETIASATALKNAGYKIFVLVIGTQVLSNDPDGDNLRYLQGLASTPTANFYIFERTISNLVPRTSEILALFCGSIAIPPTTPPPTTPPPTTQPAPTCPSSATYTQTRAGSAADSELHITYRAAAQEVDIMVRSEVSGDQWIGFGINNVADMTGADIVIAYVAPDGRTVIKDRKATADALPDVDGTQNIMYASVSKVGNTVTMIYTRKMNTGDAAQDLVISNTNCPYVLFAVGSGYNLATDGADYHSWRAASATRVCFCPPALPEPRYDLDVGIHVGSSAAAGQPVFNLFRGFAQSIIQGLPNFGEHRGSLVATSKFSTNYMLHYDLYKYTLPAQQGAASTDAGGMSYVAGTGQNLRVGLFPVTLKNTRPGASQTLVVMIWGDSFDINGARERANYLKSKGKNIIIIHYGTARNADVEGLATSANHYFFLSSPGNRPTLGQDVVNLIKNSAYKVDTALSYDQTLGADLMNAKTIGHDMIGSLRRFGYVWDGSLVALQQFVNSVSNLYGFSQYREPMANAQDGAKTALGTLVTGQAGTRSITAAIAALQTRLRDEGRSDARKVAVLFVANEPTGADLASARNAANNLKMNQRLFVVDYSGSFHRELYDMATDGSHYINFNNVNAIPVKGAHVANRIYDTQTPTDVSVAMFAGSSAANHDIIRRVTGQVFNYLPQYGEVYGSHAGLIRFATTADVNFNLNANPVITNALTAINGVLNIGVGKNTHLAFAQQGIQLNGGRTGARKVAILVTDCTALDAAPPQVIENANSLKDSGVILVVYDVTSTADDVYCRDLASSPAHYVRLNTGANTQQWFSAATDVAAFVDPPPVRTLDVAVSIEECDNVAAPTWALVRNLVTNVVRNLDRFGQYQNAYVGLGKYTDTNQEVTFDLYEYETLDAIVAAIQGLTHRGGGVDLDNGFRVIERILDDARIGSFRVGVIVIYGSPTVSQAARDRLNALKDSGVRIAVINIGVNNPVTALRDLASQDSLYYPIPLATLENDSQQHGDTIATNIQDQVYGYEIIYVTDRQSYTSDQDLTVGLNIVKSQIMGSLPLFGELPGGSTAGFIAYADTPTTVFPPDRYVIDPDARQQAANAVTTTRQTTSVPRNTGAAIDAARALLFRINGRTNARKIIMLITANNPSDDAQAAATRAKNQGVTMVVFDKTVPNPNPTLRSLATSTNVVHYRHTLVSDPNKPIYGGQVLNDFKDAPIPANIAVVLQNTGDARPEFLKLRAMARHVIGDIPQFGDPSGSHVTFFTFGDAASIPSTQEWTLNQYTDTSFAQIRVDELDAGTPGLGANIDQVIRDAKTAIEATRPGSRKIIYLIVMCSQDTGGRRVTDEIIVVVICYGDKDYNLASSVSSSQRHHVDFMNLAEIQSSANQGINSGWLDPVRPTTPPPTTPPPTTPPPTTPPPTTPPPTTPPPTTPPPTTPPPTTPPPTTPPPTTPPPTTPPPTTAPPTTTEPPKRPLNTLFVLDTSTSAQLLYQDIQRIARDAVNRLPDVGHPRGTHIGVLQYSDDSQVIVNINTNPSTAAVINAINQSPRSGGGRDTADALNDAKAQLDAYPRQNAERRVVLITRDTPDDATAAQTAARNLLSAGAPVIVYHVNTADDPTLKGSVASREDLYFRSAAPDVDKLPPFVEAILNPEAGVCGRCEFVNGEYLYRDLLSCNRFQHCVGPHQVLGVNMHCAFGTFFSPTLKVCQAARDVNCPTDPCNTPGTVSYAYAQSCSAYWFCENGRTVATRCCGENESFQPGTGCIANSTCTTPCPPTYRRPACILSAISGQAAKYREEIVQGMFVTRDCAGGTSFNSGDCECSSTGPAPAPRVCTSKVYLSFDRNKKDARGNHVENPRGNKVRIGRTIDPPGTVGGGAAMFNGNQELFMPLFNNIGSLGKLLVRVRFLERTPRPAGATGPETIYGNGACGKQAMVKLSYYRDLNQVVGMIVVDHPEDGRTTRTATVNNVPGAPQWKETELRYDGTNLVVTVTGLPSATTSAPGKMASSRTALHIGSGCLNQDGFFGYEDEFYVWYRCFP